MNESAALQVVVNPDGEVLDPPCVIQRAGCELFVLVPDRSHPQRVGVEHLPRVEVGVYHRQEPVALQEIDSALHVGTVACGNPVAPEWDVVAVFVDSRYFEAQHVEPSALHGFHQAPEDIRFEVIVCVEIHDVPARGAVEAVVARAAQPLVGFGIYMVRWGAPAPPFRRLRATRPSTRRR